MRKGRSSTPRFSSAKETLNRVYAQRWADQVSADSFDELVRTTVEKRLTARGYRFNWIKRARTNSANGVQDVLGIGIETWGGRRWGVSIRTPFSQRSRDKAIELGELAADKFLSWLLQPELPDAAQEGETTNGTSSTEGRRPPARTDADPGDAPPRPPVRR